MKNQDLSTFSISSKSIHSNIKVVILGSSRPNFKEKPELYYDNKKVCVTGTIKEYKGKPEMIINNESEIKIEN